MKHGLTVKQPVKGAQKLGLDSIRPDAPEVRRFRRPILAWAALISGLLASFMLEEAEAPGLDAQCALSPVTPGHQSLEALRRAETMLDEARSLTPTEVALDELAHERWLPVLADLQSRARDPRASAAERDALEATLRRLEALGM